MNLCEKVKEKYLKGLSELINGYRAKSVELEKEGYNDEAIMEAIKVNIGEIFYTVFNESYRRACRNVEPPEREFKKLCDIYYEFFNKIPASWKEKMVKDKDHNMMEEYYKEQIKLETAEKIKCLFREICDRIDLEV